MARTGRPKKPTAAKVQAGTLRPCRERGRDEPEVERGIPDKPEWMTELSTMNAWDELVRAIPKGVLSRSDGVALAMLAEALASYIRTQGHLDVSIGRWMDETSGGNVVESAWSKARDKHWKRFVDLSAKFGLDPSARASLHVPKQDKPKKADPVAEMLGGGSPVGRIG